jgi:flagellar hook-associated protein 2
VGISVANDGGLSLDSSALDEAISDNPTAVANLFQTTARFTDARTSLVATSSKTQAGAYAIYISRAATAAAITGSAVVDPDNGLSNAGTVTITYSGIEHSVSLNAGQKISSIVDAVNAQLAADGLAITASNLEGKLKISAQSYGSGQTIAVRASALISADLGISTSDQTDTGVDVAGTLNGHTAYGSGQTLLASVGGNEEGLAISANVTAAEVGGGLALGNAVVTVGFAGLVERQISQATTSITGSISSALSGIDDRTRDIRDSIDALEQRLAKKQELLTQQLIKADSALKEMQSKIAALSNQLAGLR